MARFRFFWCVLCVENCECVIVGLSTLIQTLWEQTLKGRDRESKPNNSTNGWKRKPKNGRGVCLFIFYFFLLSAWRGGEHFPFSFPNSSSVLFFQVQVQPSTTVRSSVLLLRWWWWWWGRIFQQVATLSLSLSLHGVCLFFLFYTLYLSFLLDTTTKGKTTMRNHYPRGKRKYLLTFIFLLLLTRAEANDRTYPLRFGREEGRLLFFF